MRAVLCTFLFLFSCLPAFADTLTLKDGTKIVGSVLFQNGTEYFVSTAEGVKRTVLTDVAKIEFDPKDVTINSEQSE